MRPRGARKFAVAHYFQYLYAVKLIKTYAYEQLCISRPGDNRRNGSHHVAEDVGAVHALWPSVATVVGYAAAFYFLSFALRTIPVGVAYAIWSAVGIVLVTVVGMVVFKQTPDLPAVIGLSLIVAGVVVVNLFSKMSAH